MAELAKDTYALTMTAEGLDVRREVAEFTASHIVARIAQDEESDTGTRFVKVHLDGDGFSLTAEVSSGAAFDVLALMFRGRDVPVMPTAVKAATGVMPFTPF